MLIGEEIERDELRAAIRKLNASARRLSPHDGEDLVQEALARAVAGGVPVDALPWLRTVMRRIAIDLSRKARDVASGDAADLEQLCVELGSGPEDALIGAEQRTQVRDALDELHPRYREALLVYLEDGTAAGVADRLGMTPQAAWTLLSRARSRLREQLERAGFVPSVFGVRLAEWGARLGPSGLAVGVAVTITLSGPSATPGEQDLRVRPPAVVQTAQVHPPEPLATAPDPIPVPAAEPEAAAVAEVVEQHVDAPAEVKVETCIAEESYALPAGAQLWFEPERPTIAREVVRTVPEKLRHTETGKGCEEE